MPGSFTRKVTALALAFTFALGVFAFALAFRISCSWRYMFGAARTRAIVSIVAISFAIRTHHSSCGFGPLVRRAQVTGMTKASTIVAVEGLLLIALALNALAKCKERVVLILTISNLCPRLAPRWVDPWKRDVGLLFLLLMMVLLSKASDFHLPRENWNKRSLSPIPLLDIAPQFRITVDINGSGCSA